MYRRFVLVLVAIATLAAAFGAGAMAAVSMDWGKPIATLTVENKSGKAIASVEISISTCGTRRTLSQKDTDNPAYADQAKSYVFTLPLCGEGGHRTRVHFSDGKTVESHGSYIENGSRILERVQEDSIQSEFSSLSYWAAISA